MQSIVAELFDHETIGEASCRTRFLRSLLEENLSHDLIAISLKLHL